MLVALVDTNGNVEVNEYPYIKSVDDIKNDFFDNVLMIELIEKPEIREGYILKYDGSDFYYEEIQQPDPTETELIQAELLLNQADILARQNEQDEVLAEILLNQMGV